MSNNYIGDIAEDADVYFVFDTASASGASITATVVVADIEVYRQIAAPINLIQRSSTSGFTLAVNHDGATGTHMVCIDTSDNTDAGFFTTGYDYFVKLNTVTVDGVSISKWIGHFSVENRYTGADVVAISGDTAAADNLESMLDGTGGVTLSLGNLVVASSGGTHAVTFTGHGAGAGLSCIGGELDGNGIECGGDGVDPTSTGAAMKLMGGATQIGLEVLGGGTSGDAIKASATDGHGMYLAGDENNEGFEAVGEGTAAGMTARGGSDGDGLYAASGYNGGEGIYAYGQAVASNGLKAESGGAGKDINAAEIDSIISKVDVVDGIVDDILLDTAEIGTAGAGLTEAGGTGDQLTAIPWNSVWDTEVQSECTDALTTYDSSGGVAKENSVLAIQNNTRFVATVPTYMFIPAAGTTMYKITALFYDSDGNMEDPDNNELDILYESVDGTDKDAFFDEASGSTPASSGTIDVNMWKMVKISTGVYETYYKLPSTESVDQWSAVFKLEEATAELQYSRSTSVLDADPASVDANIISISGDSTAADNLEAMLDGTGGVTLSLGQLAIVASSNDDAIIATGSGTGAGIISTGGSYGGCGAVFLGDDGAIPSGIAYGMAIHSGEINGGGLSLLGEGIVEPAIKAIANRADAVQFTSGGSGGSGLRVTGDAGGDGIEVRAGATGAGISIAGGTDAGGGDAISATTAGSGEALNNDILNDIGANIWDTTSASHVSAGTTGKILNDLEAEHTDDTLMVQTTIATYASQTSFTLSSGSTADDTYIGCTIIIRDNINPANKGVGIVSDYIGSSKTVTLAYDPGVFSYSSADFITILAAPNKVSLGTQQQLTDAVWDEDLDPAHITAGTAGKAVLDIETDATAIKSRLPVLPTKGTALNAFPFLMISSTDHVTPITGLSAVAATRSIDGGGFYAISPGTVSEIANGLYKINLSVADMGGDTIVLRFIATGADDRIIVLVTQPTD